MLILNGTNFLSDCLEKTNKMDDHISIIELHEVYTEVGIVIILMIINV